MGNLVIASFALLQDKQFQLRGAHVPVRDFTGINDDMVLVDPQLPTAQEWETATYRAAELFGIAAGQMRTAANVGALARELAAAASERRVPCRDLVAVLEAHATTLGLAADSPRLATAGLGMSLIEGLASAGDDVARVAGLAAMDGADRTAAVGQVDVLGRGRGRRAAPARLDDPGRGRPGRRRRGRVGAEGSGRPAQRPPALRSCTRRCSQRWPLPTRRRPSGC